MRELSQLVSSPMSWRKKQDGFTAIEMLVVIALIAVLSALALPSFNGLVEKYRINAMTSAMSASISYARTEAIRSGQSVTLQRRSTCADIATTQEWTCGWDVVQGTTTLKSQGRDAQVTVMVLPSKASIAFNAFGQATAAIGRFVVAPEQAGVGSPNVVTLCLTAGGRMRTFTGDATCPS